MGKYTGVIFDLDGVICFTDKYHYQAWKAVADKLGIYFDETINNRLRGVSRMDSLEIILERYDGQMTQAEKEALAEEKNNLYRQLLANMSPADLSAEVKETLDALRGMGLKLAIGSSSKNTKFILARLGLGDYFDAISDGTNITRSKPDPQVFQMAAEFIGMKPETCLVVEDAKAGIEAARAGEGGRGFAVVAEQIRVLSTETQASSGQIQEALEHLEKTSAHMTEAIQKTLELIQLSFDKVNQTNQSVEKITADSGQLGRNIEVIDSAMKEVEKSNTHLVENMEQVSGVVETMTDRISHSDETTKTMLSKYTETVLNIDSIEHVVENLMTELGIGGFMGVEDLKKGMKVMLISHPEEGEPEEYHGELVESHEDGLLVTCSQVLPMSNKKEMDGEMQITVGNILYCWDNVKITKPSEQYKVLFASRPKIYNRRKYPRLDMTLKCQILDKESGETFDGCMENISANGFAFSSKNSFFAEAKGKEIAITIPDFELKDQRQQEGRILRCSDNEGTYIVGCQMPEDNYEIMQYVNNALA